jgi:hypothetical protein
MNQDDIDNAYRGYDERFVDIQAEMDEYYQNLEDTSQENVSASTDAIKTISTNSSLDSIPGISSAQESRDTQSILDDAFDQLINNQQPNTNINMDIIGDTLDTAFADVSAALDVALNGMCQ